ALDLDLEVEKVGQLFFEGLGVGVLLARGAGDRSAWRGGADADDGAALYEGFDLTDVEAPVKDLLSERLGVVATDESAGVASRDAAVLHHGLHASGQLQQAQSVGDVAARLADDLGQLLLAVVEALDQLAITGGFFDGVEVGALDVLDDSDFENFFVVEI